MRLIDADEVLARIENPYQRAEIARWLRDAPTIERKTGKWIEIEPPDIYVCPFCKHASSKKNFCGECGADMRGE